MQKVGGGHSTFILVFVSLAMNAFGINKKCYANVLLHHQN